MMSVSIRSDSVKNPSEKADNISKSTSLPIIANKRQSGEKSIFWLRLRNATKYYEKEEIKGKKSIFRRFLFTRRHPSKVLTRQKAVQITHSVTSSRVCELDETSYSPVKESLLPNVAKCQLIDTIEPSDDVCEKLRVKRGILKPPNLLKKVIQRSMDDANHSHVFPEVTRKRRGVVHQSMYRRVNII